MDSFYSSAMVGAGETFLPAFALAIGMSEVTAGLLSAFPFLAGSILQLGAPEAVRRLGSLRRWVVTCAMIQALSFGPLVYCALQGAVPPAMLLAIATLYWASGLASAPAWNSWMSSLVPLHLRASYFARRNRLGQVGLLAGLVGGGLLLQEAKGRGHELWAFAAVFLAAGLSRTVSAFYLSRQSERKASRSDGGGSGLWDVLQRLQETAEGRLLLFLMVFQVAVQFSGPFFNPYMLRHLQLNYAAYMGLVAASFVAKIIFFPLVGRWGQKFGSFRLLQAGAMGSAVVPLLWVFSTDYVYLAASQVLSGLVWAVFDLGVCLALFDTVKDKERTAFMSLYNLGNALAIFAGTLGGAQLLKALGEQTSSYLILFCLSAILRFGTCFVLERVLKYIARSRHRDLVRERPPSGGRPASEQAAAG